MPVGVGCFHLGISGCFLVGGVCSHQEDISVSLLTGALLWVFSLGSLVIQKFRASDMEAMVLGCYLKAACRCLICIQSRVGFSSK